MASANAARAALLMVTAYEADGVEACVVVVVGACVLLAGCVAAAACWFCAPVFAAVEAAGWLETARIVIRGSPIKREKNRELRPAYRSTFQILKKYLFFENEST
ncbi:hypothetical protein [Paraburkholderia ferrariae]|uniref:Uncharacterized protein n=1 Tax=Paraburkholderia ferrariae TaxID=386056 RepID=A0ABU9RK09_9BURK